MPMNYFYKTYYYYYYFLSFIIFFFLFTEEASGKSQGTPEPDSELAVMADAIDTLHSQKRLRVPIYLNTLILAHSRCQSLYTNRWCILWSICWNIWSYSAEHKGFNLNGTGLFPRAHRYKIFTLAFSRRDWPLNDLLNRAPLKQCSHLIGRP